MSNPAIRVRNLSKTFHLGDSHVEASPTLREAITGAASKLVRSLKKNRTPARSKRDEFQALRDVSFDIQPGEIVGVVGRNGAGKSTFLKIVCRITPPSSGFVQIRGRIGSLLEVGTGFHPELTGRENVYLNGSILGMGRKQIARDFDAIVDFAEISQFIDTPVKRYSSGMYVRLAFAVASQLKPDVLIVDEVLAVGDSQFQKKCLGKMSEVRKNGQTVLFVSHNMVAVRSLCTRGILLEGGELTMDGSIDQIVQKYLDDGQPKVGSREIPEGIDRISNDSGRIRRVSISDMKRLPVSELRFGEPFRVSFECEIFEEVIDGLFEVSVSTQEGTQILMATTIDGGRVSKRLIRGRHVVGIVMRSVLLPGEYVINIGIHHKHGETIDYVPRACAVEVMHLGLCSTDNYPWQSVRGYVQAIAQWDEHEATEFSNN